MKTVVLKSRSLSVPVYLRLLQVRALLPAASLLILGLLVLLPLLVMGLASVRPANTFPFEGEVIGLANYLDVFGQPGTAVMLRNTAVFAAGALILALPAAFGLAFLTERTDIPFRDGLYTLMFVPMSIPPFATALAWVLLAGDRAGTLNQWIRYALGLQSQTGPFNVFSLEGMIAVQALGMVPSMWLILIGVLRNMDPALEEAAATSGAGRLSTLLIVTVPLMAPGILAVIVLFFITGLEALEVPLALGRSAGIDVLSSQVYDLLNRVSDQGFHYGLPASLGVFGLSIGLVGVSIYLYLVRRSSRFQVVTGKGYRPRRLPLGWWKYPALAAVALFFVVDFVLPLLVLVTTSLQRFYQPLVPGNRIVWTLANYNSLLDFRFFGQAFLNTLLVAVVAATITMVLVSLFAWQVVRWPSQITQTINALAFLPLTVPAVISGLAFFLLFIGTPVYGTLVLLVLAFTARYIAFGTRLMHAAQIQIHKELEEAAQTVGAGFLVTFIHVNLRLLAPAFINGWLWVLAHVARDFTTPLLVASAGSMVAANEIFGRFMSGNFPAAAAMMVALMAFNIVVVLTGRKWIVRAIAG